MISSISSQPSVIASELRGAGVPLFQSALELILGTDVLQVDRLGEVVEAFPLPLVPRDLLEQTAQAVLPAFPHHLASIHVTSADHPVADERSPPASNGGEVGAETEDANAHSEGHQVAPEVRVQPLTRVVRLGDVEVVNLREQVPYLDGGDGVGGHLEHRSEQTDEASQGMHVSDKPEGDQDHPADRPSRAVDPGGAIAVVSDSVEDDGLSLIRVHVEEEAVEEQLGDKEASKHREDMSGGDVVEEGLLRPVEGSEEEESDHGRDEGPRQVADRRGVGVQSVRRLESRRRHRRRLQPGDRNRLEIGGRGSAQLLTERREFELSCKLI